MNIADESIQPLRTICPNAQAMTDGPHTFIFLPKLRIVTKAGELVHDAILLLTGGAPYPTRLFVPEQIVTGLNWNGHESFLGRSWHTWSWKDVPNTLPLMDILGAHLRAFVT